LTTERKFINFDHKAIVMNSDLSNKCVLITAGASGIGREIGNAFITEGARVYICDIDEQALNTVASEDPRIKGCVCDVSDPDAVERMIVDAVATLGGLDILVNNAGISGPTARLEQTDPATWTKVLDVNLVGTFNVTRLAIPHLKKSSNGVIINMSSVAGRFGYPMRSAYATSKWGLIGLTKSLSIELGEFGIRVNAILPGAVDGPRFQKVLEGRAQHSGRTIEEEAADALRPMSIKKLVDVKQIAGLAVFLSSDYAATISGQAISIDGDMQSIA
jgi:NAD(P)-dependent dehydrogenase (short-subunit alcohol dehydrogenase family)